MRGRFKKKTVRSADDIDIGLFRGGGRGSDSLNGGRLFREVFCPSTQLEVRQGWIGTGCYLWQSLMCGLLLFFSLIEI